MKYWLSLFFVFTCSITKLSGFVIHAPYTLKGKVVRIVDGDTFDLLVDKTTHRIRLAGIDAPEKGQDFGTAAKQMLGSFCAGATVTVVVADTDRNKRKIAEVYTEQKLWVNKEMIVKGMAWHFVKYSKSKELAAAEQQARKSKIGLWSAANAIAPWDWRKRPRN